MPVLNQDVCRHFGRPLERQSSGIDTAGTVAGRHLHPHIAVVGDERPKAELRTGLEKSDALCGGRFGLDLRGQKAVAAAHQEVHFLLVEHRNLWVRQNGHVGHRFQSANEQADVIRHDPECQSARGHVTGETRADTDG